MTNYDILKEYEAHKTPVPTYDEYKAMQKELAELKEKIKKREELIQCLGSNIDELDVKNRFLSLKTTSSEDC